MSMFSTNTEFHGRARAEVLQRSQVAPGSERWVMQPLVLTLFGPLALLCRAGTRRFLVAVALVDVPLQVGGHLWNRNEIADFGGLGGLNLSVTTLAVGLLYLSAVVEYLATGHAKQAATRWSKSLTVYVGITAASAVVAVEVDLTAFEVALFAQSLLLFVYVANWIRSRGDVLFVIRFLLLGLVCESALMIWLALAGGAPAIQGIHLRVDVDSGVARLTRVAGTVGSPNGAGAYLSILLSIAAAVLLAGVKSRTKVLAAVGFAAGTLALVLTYSRGALTAFLFSMGIIFLASTARHGIARKWVIAVVLVVAVVVGLLHTSLATRVLGEDAGAAYSRVPLMNLAFRMIADHPLLGVGANNFVPAMDDYVTGEFRHEFLYTVHNRYLLIWAETGLIGLIAYLWFLFSTLRRGWQCWVMRDELLSPIALGLTAAIGGHMVQMLVDAFRGRPLTQLVWLAAAVITAIHVLLQQSRSAPEYSYGSLHRIDQSQSGMEYCSPD